MKFIYPSIQYVFDMDIMKINTLVIENQSLFSELLTDIHNQQEGFDGKSVLSQNNAVLPISKNLELLTDFIPFDINKKTLLNKITAMMENEATVSDRFIKTSQLMSDIEAYLNDLSFDISANIDFPKLEIGNIIKSASPVIVDDYNSLGEKLIDYMQLATEFAQKRLFVTVNLRSFMSDEECTKFMKSVLAHQLSLIMIESCEHQRLDAENRVLIDVDLCEIY